jgi:uncharacterized damage-inducible protein DinB
MNRTARVGFKLEVLLKSNPVISPWILLEQNVEHCKCDTKLLPLNIMSLFQSSILWPTAPAASRFALAPGLFRACAQATGSSMSGISNLNSPMLILRLLIYERLQPNLTWLMTSEESMNAEKYRRWFEYEQDSNAKVLASLQAVAEPSRGMPQFQKAVDLLAHLVAARNIWLYRLGYGIQPLELFPAETSLSRLPELLDEMQAAWRSYFESLTDGEAARLFEYQSFDGPRVRNTVEDVLTQLYGHSLYHRGQIAMLLRSIGAEPALTDFIYWAREAIPDA